MREIKEITLQTNDDFNIKMRKVADKIYIQSWDFANKKIDYKAEVNSFKEVEEIIKYVYMREWKFLDYSRKELEDIFYKWKNY